MGNHMVDAYVRRDPNAKNHYDSLGSSDDDSWFCPMASSCRPRLSRTRSQTQYTLAELGIDMAASPYVEALTYEDSDTSDVIVTPHEVHHHAEDLIDSVNPATRSSQFDHFQFRYFLRQRCREGILGTLGSGRSRRRRGIFQDVGVDSLLSDFNVGDTVVSPPSRTISLLAPWSTLYGKSESGLARWDE